MNFEDWTSNPIRGMTILANEYARFLSTLGWSPYSLGIHYMNGGNKSDTEVRN